MAETGLLLLLNRSSLTRVNADSILRKAAALVSKRLYVELQRSVVTEPSAVFDFVQLYYSLGSSLCGSLDLRILCGPLKQSTIATSDRPKPLDAVLFDRAKSDVTAELLQKFGDVKCHFIPADPSGPELPDDTRMFGKIEGSRHQAIPAAYNYAVLGGTFDRFHTGHKILITAAILLANKGVTVGVTDEEMHKRKVLSELIEPLETRMASVKEFFSDVDPTVVATVVPISDPFGPSIVDSQLECIVVSEETIGGGRKVNEKRKEKGLSQLDLYAVNLASDVNSVEAHMESKISSSNRRKLLLGELIRPLKVNDKIPQFPHVVGLTGGIASGKTHIAAYLKELGAVVIDCDKLGHKAYEPGTEAYRKIVEQFGSDVIDSETNTVNRAVLGAKVFTDKAKLQQLNNIVWPAIAQLAKDEINQAAAEGKRIVVLDAAVLLEAGWDSFVHEIWTVYVPHDEAIKRMIERNKLTGEAAQKRRDAQMPLKERLARANVVFCSLWEYQFTRSQVLKAYQNLLARL